MSLSITKSIGSIQDPINRSSRSQMLFHKNVKKNFGNFTGKNLRWSLFKKVPSLQAGPATSLKEDSNTGVFLWNL